MKLSRNFSKAEFLTSSTAERRGFILKPSTQIVCNMRTLCEVVLQPFRNDRGNIIRITSGYRSLELNTAIGGARNSAHMTGRAADFHEEKDGEKIDAAETFKFMARSRIPYDKIILEYGSWVHVQYAKQGNSPRRLIYISSKRDGKTVYKRLTL